MVGVSPPFPEVRVGGVDINPVGDVRGSRLGCRRRDGDQKREAKVRESEPGPQWGVCWLLAPGASGDLLSPEVTALRPRQPPGARRGGCVQRIPGDTTAQETLIRSFYT